MMASASSLAILCLIASGLLDLVFKKYATKPRSRGMLIFGIGCVWLMMQLIFMYYTDNATSFGNATLGYGIVAAIFLTASNILLLECMGHLPISMGSTIYRLNTVPLIIIAILVLGEEIDFMRALGIGCGLLTVFLLYQPSHKRKDQYPHYVLFVSLIIVASIVRALYGIVTKAGVNNGGDPNTMMLLAAVGWCIGGIAYAHFREHRVVINMSKLKYIPIAGTLVFSIVWLLTTALTLGDASVVVPITNMGFVAAFLFSIGVHMESINLRKSGAIGLAIISIVLLTGSA